jgi:methyl-accepting chemotaxis protein
MALFQKLWIKIAIPTALVCWVIVEIVIQVLLNTSITRTRSALGERLRDVAIAAAAGVTGEQHNAAMANPSGMEFQQITSTLNNLRTKLSYKEHWYTLTPSPNEQTTFGIMTHPKPFVGDKYTIRDASVIKTFHEAVNAGKAGYSDIYRSDNGVWLSGFAPIVNADGKTAAVLEVDITYSDYLELENQIRLRGWLLRLLGIVLSVITALMLGRYIARPVEQLQKVAQQVGEGDFSIKPNITQKDEIGALSTSFGGMIDNIRKLAELAEQERRRSIRKSEQAAEDARNEVIEQQFYLENEVKRINTFLGRIRQKDLRGSLIASKDDDTVSDLVEALNAAIAEQRHTIVEIQDASSELASVSAQIAGNADQISTKSADQARRVAEIAGAIETMSANITDSSANIGRTSDVSQSVVDAAKSGQAAVRSTVEGMTMISGVVSSMKAVVEKLSGSSGQIGQIVEAIEEIADQTNLLALNAAIEAARAGEAGKGFAVVADEVRKLAEKTQKATKEITKTIGIIQQDTRHATETAVSGAHKVGEGITLAENAGQQLGAIVRGIENVNELIIQIATASEVQAETAAEIAKNIDFIRTSVEENTSGVQEVARAVGSITNQATHLNHVAEQFILEDDSNSARLNVDAPNALKRLRG